MTSAVRTHLGALPRTTAGVRLRSQSQTRQPHLGFAVRHDGNARPSGWRCSRPATAPYAVRAGLEAPAPATACAPTATTIRTSGYWFDPDKLLVDPYAVAIDRPYAYDAAAGGAARRGRRHGAADAEGDRHRAAAGTAGEAAAVTPGGLIYEAHVRALHHAPPRHSRSRCAARRRAGAPGDHRALQKLGVVGVELMPVVAWIDERHLPPLGLTNAWGYNPVTFKALDPRLAPGGIAELRDTVAALHAAGIGVILDLVFNHTGESDGSGRRCRCAASTTAAIYRHAPDNPGELVNDTGTGNTIACDSRRRATLVLDALRHFVLHAGVDGFRFDLATVLGRVGRGFSPTAPLLQAIVADPVLADRVLIAEPWDIGPGGYQLGNFPPPFLEWNDHFRDDVRRFWRGDSRHDRHAGDAACRFVRRLPAGRASRRRAASTSSPPMTG